MRSTPRNPTAEGLHYHRLGELDRASALYSNALALNPGDVRALHGLGVLRHQQGRSFEAVQLLEKAARLTPNDVALLGDLGVALAGAGRLLDAVGAYRRALAGDGTSAPLHNRLGVALCALGRPAEAEPVLRAALGLHPNLPEAHNNLGIALRDLGRTVEAEASFRTVLRLRPDAAEAQINLANVLRDLGRPAEAEEIFRKVLRTRPDSVEGHLNLGNALRDLGRLDEAAAAGREAVRLRPGLAEAHNNLASVLHSMGLVSEAETSYREALRLKPAFHNARCNLAYLLLLAGRFEEGWREHEHRWKAQRLASGARDFSQPLWHGEPIGGRTLLLHAEQGLGDTLQFCRYVPLAASGARIVLEVQGPLTRLLSRLSGVAEIRARGEALPPFDFHCPLMSLPLAFGTTLDTIPGTTPYLTADAAQAAAWRERLAGLGGLRVGLVWAGSARSEPELAAVNRRRSIALGLMAPLAEAPGVSFVSLQKSEAAGETANPPTGLVLHDYTDELRDFADTAALVDGLDLVISVDTSVAHLAGALGKPVWLLNRYDTCWRWLLERDDSPWYPTLRQFRQPTPGDWRSVMRAVGDALKRLADGDRSQLEPPQAA